MPSAKAIPRLTTCGFVDEMKLAAMKLHTRDQAKDGGREEDPEPFHKWEPSMEGYLRFLMDSKILFHTLETIVNKDTCPWYGELRNTGLERSKNLEKDLNWLEEQKGHAIPQPSSSGSCYALYLEDLSQKDPQAFLCHFYNIYFAHSAGGRMIGRMVSKKILEGTKLTFYEWEGNLPQLLQGVREKLNLITKSWSQEEKARCLEETERSFKFSAEILQMINS